MNPIKRIVASTTLALGLAGCITPTAVVSTHTLTVEPHREVDTIWLISESKLYRCTGAGDKPACEVVRELR